MLREWKFSVITSCSFHTLEMEGQVKHIASTISNTSNNTFLFSRYWPLEEGSTLALLISANWVAVVFVYQRGTKWCVCLHDNERLSSVREAVKEVIRVAHRCSVSDPSRSKQVWQKWLFGLLRTELCWTKVNGFHSCPPLSTETLVRSAHVPLLELNCCWLYLHQSCKVASEGFRL